jgi:putative phage-type endonuclease
MLTEEQKAARKSGIGGSDAAAVLGASPWKTPFQLWQDKLGLAPEQEETQAMRLGSILEPTVAYLYMEETGISIEKPVQMFKHPQYPWMLANLDGLAPDRIVEFKTARSADGWGEPGSDEIPVQYAAQVFHYMEVMGKDRADVGVLIGGSDYRTYTLHADRALQDALVEAEKDFWSLVVSGTPPEIKTAKDAALRWPKSTGKHVSATADIELAVERIAHLKAQIKELEEDLGKQEDIVKPFMGEADALQSSAGIVLATWKSAKDSTTFDRAAFEKAHPDLFAKYQKTTTGSRRFLIK